MRYRNLGKTGLKVSEIAMGCEGFAENDCRNAELFFDIAEENGINYFDLYTSNPEVRASVGRALQGRRDKFIIQSHLCSIWKDGQYKRSRNIREVREGFEEMLSLLQTDYVDVEDLWREENYANPLLNMDPGRQRLYEVCQEMGVGITVMKAFGGGDLLDETLSPAAKALTVNQCLHYALTRPAVATVLAGARTEEQLRESLAYETASEEEKDYAMALASFPNISWKGHCMYCSHCAPCPEKIDVASVTKFLNLAKAREEVPETVREHYEVLEHHAGECIRCGGCETRCPFEVPIMENMAAAAEIFGR